MLSTVRFTYPFTKASKNPLREGIALMIASTSERIVPKTLLRLRLNKFQKLQNLFQGAENDFQH